MGADADLFVGQWSYRAGAVNHITCAGQSRDVALTGMELLERGSGGGLEWVSQSLGCRVPLAVGEDIARVGPGHACHVSAGSNSGTIDLAGSTFSLAADALVESGLAAVVYDDGRACSGVITGTLGMP